MTGRYPDKVGVPGVIRQNAANSWGYLDPNAITLPQMLKKAGYHTAMVGKWHLGYESPNIPNDRGFDFFHGFLGDMMDDYYNHRRWGVNWMRKNRREIDPEGHATELFSDWAIDYFESRKGKRTPSFSICPITRRISRFSLPMTGWSGRERPSRNCPKAEPKTWPSSSILITTLVACWMGSRPAV